MIVGAVLGEMQDEADDIYNLVIELQRSQHSIADLQDLPRCMVVSFLPQVVCSTPTSCVAHGRSAARCQQTSRRGSQPQKHDHLGLITVTQGSVGSGEPDY